MAELYTFRPLFPGSSEIDQLFKICSLMGTPDKSIWPEGHRLASSIHFQFPDCQKVPLTSIVSKASTYGHQLLEDMLSWDPERRPTAQQAMKYPFFEASKRPTVNILGSSQFGSNSSYLSSQNTINDILSKMNLNVVEAPPPPLAPVKKLTSMDLVRQSSKEKINDLLLFSTNNLQNSNKPDANNKTNRKGFFLHQQPTTFPDSGIGDEDQEMYNNIKPSYIQVPVVVHKWTEGPETPPKRRLSNLSLIAKMTPVNQWALNDAIEGGGNDGDDEQEEDELGKILGWVALALQETDM